MEKLIEDISRFLRERYPGAELDLEETVPGRKIGGFLIWEGFVGKEHIDRQSELWRSLRSELPSEQWKGISALFTLTPDEMAAAREG